MKGCLCLFILLAVCVSGARADEPWPLFNGCRWAWPNLCELWRQRRCWCPDDYAAKTLPAVELNAKGCVDDYCPKTLPAVAPNAKGCVDDYCPKTCPLLFGRLCEPWYICGPPTNTGAAPCQRCTPRP
jgi:hypothetical protein